jgi:RNA polymerase sigma-70 factor (ECF subfamily)
VINNSIVEYRKSQRFVEVSEENIADEAEEDQEYANDDYSEVRSTQLMECMKSLHDSYKDILTLHFIEGYDYEEICEILEISYANCRTLISRAKESLRKKLMTVAI